MVYVIMKDGTKIKTAKNLSVAKEIADKEKAEVFVNGKCVYPKAQTAVKEAEASQEPEPARSEPEQEPLKPVLTPYKLKAKMNIREKPSLSARKLDTAKTGTIVQVYEIRNDWMKIKWYDGIGFVLYSDGKFAETC